MVWFAGKKIMKKFFKKSITPGFWVSGSEDEEKLIIDLFRSYNSLIRPVQIVSAHPIKVNFSLAMILLINVV